MDPDISGWIIEFVLRELVEDNLVKRLLSEIPSIPTADSRLIKTLLLRTIQSEISSNVLSEEILDHFERIQELDSSQAAATASQSIKDAYCAAAVQCAVQILEGKADNRESQYYHSVVRIWTQRIGDMVERLGERGLVSEQLRKCKVELEASVWDAKVRQNLLGRDTRDEAVRLVTNYLNEEWGKMGPSFLQTAAAHQMKQKVAGDVAHVGTAIARNEDIVNDLDAANVIQANEGGAGNARVDVTQAQIHVENPSLMAPNSTASTFRRDDSIDNDLPDIVPTRVRTVLLGSPRRRKKRWSVAEEDVLRKAVQKYGLGNWKHILNTYRDVFDERTEVDLKDKWRNMTTVYTSSILHSLF